MCMNGTYIDIIRTIMWNQIVDLVKGKKTFEFGGPSELFANPSHNMLLYPYISSIDFGNMDNPWQGEIRSSFNHYGNSIGDVFAVDATDTEAVFTIGQNYDLVLSSHVIEHIANPIKALKNWGSLLIDDGLILSIIPNKSEFWDHNRPTTSIKHLIKDYNNDIGEDDLTHVEEEIRLRDWSRGGMDGKVIKSVEHHAELARDNFNNRILHHHCFDVDLVSKIHEYSGYETIICDILPTNRLQLIYLGRKT
jgi:SAM-dependent methyltransferase